MNARGEFFCISGPDQGKRVALGEHTVLLGGTAGCGLLSDDAALGGEQVALKLINGRLHFRSSAPALLFVDGIRATQGALDPGGQLRAGRSCWQFAGQPAHDNRDPLRTAPRRHNGLFTQAAGFVNALVGLEAPAGNNVKEVFSAATRKRSESGVTEIFAVGTSRHTPSLMEIDTNWPQPWVFLKALGLAVMVYLGFVFAFKQFHNANLIPGLIMVGASAIPITVVLFYFEMNAARNVSLHQVIRMVLLGGVVSLITSLFGFQMFGQSLDWLGASQAGIVEEAGKLLALLLIVNKTKYRWTLNGLLFGGAVGAGFAAFESAGYAYRIGLAETFHGLNDLERMFENIWVRGLLTPGGHVAWTALVGAALWRVRGERPFALAMLLDERFLRVFALAVGLHMIWNSPFELPYYGKFIALIAIAWMTIFGFIQDGLNQIRRAQEEAGGFINAAQQSPQRATV